jgi:AraC-like DNA-binding protein
MPPTKRQREELIDHRPSLDFAVWSASQAVMDYPHTHPDVEVNFIRRGVLRYMLHGRFLEIGAGEIVVFWAGFPHQTLEKNLDIEGIWLTIPLPWLLRGKHTNDLAGILLKGEVIHWTAGGHAEKVFEQWRRDFSGTDLRIKDIARSEVESYFARLAISQEKKTSRGLSSGEGPIERVLTFLAAHYHEEFTVADISREVGLHPKYLLVLFRRVCRMTLWDYVVRLRLAHAQRLLLTTDRTVADIAFEAGFQSLSSFYQAFRKHGPASTPAAFRAGAG